VLGDERLIEKETTVLYAGVGRIPWVNPGQVRKIPNGEV
jgi:hypothetical protein